MSDPLENIGLVRVVNRETGEYLTITPRMFLSAMMGRDVSDEDFRRLKASVFWTDKEVVLNQPKAKP